MKRLDYEAPTMELIVVEMEEGFLAASVVHSNTSNVETTGHELNSVDFEEETWNDGKWD